MPCGAPSLWLRPASPLLLVVDVPSENSGSGIIATNRGPKEQEEIVENGYDLSINRYKAIVYEEVEYEKPKVILQKIRDLEKEIIVCLKDLNVMELD